MLFTAEESSVLLRAKDSEIRIPKLIHYCWFGRSEMPEKFQANIDSWRRCCPDYEIIRWDESNYDVEKNRYMKQAYESKCWGFVPDYARMDIVHQCGGIYMDTDVELLRSLDDLLACKFFCGFESVSFIALGLGFGAEKNNILLEETMEPYGQMDFILEDGSLNPTPSPKYQTQVLVKHGPLRNGQTQITPEFAALSAKYFCPINPYGAGQPTADSFSIHHYAATWFHKEQRKEKDRLTRNYCFCDSREQDAAQWLRERTKGTGAGAFFEYVGKNETVSLAVNAAAPGGRICLVGNPVSSMKLEKEVYWKILRNQLTVTGTWNSSFTRSQREI